MKEKYENNFFALIAITLNSCALPSLKKIINECCQISLSYVLKKNTTLMSQYIQKAKLVADRYLELAQRWCIVRTYFKTWYFNALYSLDREHLIHHIID